MISRDELAAALRRLDPRDWELLDLSLRRRVPDEALAKVFGTEPSEVARRRAAAIEHLADALEVQRGEDLGAVLKALLDSETWEAADGDEGWEAFASEPGAKPRAAQPAASEPAAGEPAAADLPAATPPVPGEPLPEPVELKTSEAARLFRLTPAPDPIAEPEPQAAESDPAPGPAPEPDPAAEPEPARAHGPAQAPAQAAAAPAHGPAEAPASGPAEAPAHGPAQEPARGPVAAPTHAPAHGPAAAPAQDPAEAPAPATPAPVFAPRNGSELPGPVLEMLAERDQGRRGGGWYRSPLAYALAGGLGAAALLAAGWFGARALDDSGDPAPSEGEQGPRRFLPEQGGPLAAPFPSDPRTTSCYSTAYVRRATVVYERPGGRRKLKLPATTEWGSPRVLSVVRRRGDWLAVLAPELKNGEVGWMQTADATRIDCVRWSLHVDLSRRRLYVRRDGRTVRKLAVAIGSKRHPTPKGRFAVTDKLRVTDKGSPYGCCVLALTGHQTRLPADWPGGDRLAVHATTDLSSIGKPVSLGCMRSSPQRVKWLIKQVPLGSPIFIRA